jgi:hypothetical protein
MNYAKDHQKDDNYVSVNTLTKPSKNRGLSLVPSHAAEVQTKELDRQTGLSLPGNPSPESDIHPEPGQTNSPVELNPGQAADQTALAANIPSQAVSTPESGTAGVASPENETPEIAAPETGAQDVANQDPGTPETSETGTMEAVTPEGESQDAVTQETETQDASTGDTAVEPFQQQQENEGLKEEKELKSDKKSGLLQAKSFAGGASGADAPETGVTGNTLNSLRGGGEPLPEGLRRDMEGSMGADFKDVRLHRDEQSASLAGQLGAKAFTNQTDIYFNQNQYNPDTPGGRHLIAHELAHVEQQRTIPGLQYQLEVPAERDRYEQEADTVADKVTNSPAPVQPSSEKLTSPVTKSSSNSVQLAKEESSSNWLLDKVGGLLKNIPGYDMLILVIGRDPVSGREVKRDGFAFIKAIVGLIPGGKLLLENLEKAGIISRAVAWFKDEFQKLNITFNTIKSLFDQALKSINWNLIKSFEKIKNIFLAPIQRIINFIGSAGSKLMEFIFEGALTLAGAPVKSIMGILNKGKEVLGKIIKDPIGFLKNLLSAVKGGLGNFAGNIVTHLQNGIGGWIFGALGKAGITLPEKLNLAGIFHIAAQVLGVTWQAIKALVAKRLGPIADKVMNTIEKSVDFVVTFITKGPMALLDMAKDFLAELKTLFFDTLIEWVRNTIIVKAIQKLISMFNPVGAIIQAVITIYNTIQFFIERAKQIAAFVGAVFNSIAEIAGGNIGKAVAAVENALAKGVPVAISFLANLIGLGGIAKKVQEIIKRIRKPIDKVVGKVVGFVVDKAKMIWGKMVSTGKAVKEKVTGVKDKIVDWWKMRKEFKTKNGEQHTLFFEGEGKNARLIVQSDRMAIEDFLIKAKGPKNEKYIQDAEKILPRIKELQHKLPDKITGRKMTSKNDPSQQQDFLELRQLLIDLANTISYMQVETENKENEFPVVIYPPFVNNVKAHEETKVSYLSMAEGKGFQEGSRKTSDSVVGWNRIVESEIQQTKGGTYVRIHLIPECLGGYGTDSNLTPGKQILNMKMKNDVEQPAKKAIEDKQTMIWYDVSLECNKDDKDFISSINVQWGYYEFNKEQKKWIKSQNVPQGKEKPKSVHETGIALPNLDTIKININKEDDPKMVQQALKIPETAAELIIKERLEKGNYAVEDIEDIFDRVKKLAFNHQETIRSSHKKGYFIIK